MGSRACESPDCAQGCGVSAEPRWASRRDVRASASGRRPLGPGCPHALPGPRLPSLFPGHPGSRGRPGQWEGRALKSVVWTGGYLAEQLVGLHGLYLKVAGRLKIEEFRLGRGCCPRFPRQHLALARVHGLQLGRRGRGTAHPTRGLGSGPEGGLLSRCPRGCVMPDLDLPEGLAPLVSTDLCSLVPPLRRPVPVWQDGDRDWDRPGLCRPGDRILTFQSLSSGQGPGQAHPARTGAEPRTAGWGPPVGASKCRRR